MRPSRLDRALFKTAQRRVGPMIRPWIVGLARLRGSLGPRPETELGFAAGSQYKYLFAEYEASAAVAGSSPESAAEALRGRGYANVGLLDAQRESAEHVVVAERLDRLSRSAAMELLNAAATSASRSVLAFAACYPENLLGPDRGRRQWLSAAEWRAEFAPPGFVAEASPRERPGGLTPLIFSRREKPTPPRARGVARPRAAFVMPNLQNSFRMVAEALAEAATDAGYPIDIVSPGDDTGLETRITWSHFWRQYRDISVPRGRQLEFFVGNFTLTPQGELTDWLRELTARNTVKLVPSEFCRKMLVGLGVDDTRIRVIPHGYSPEFAVEALPLSLATRKQFRFLAVVNSHDPERFGLDLLMGAYRRAFSASDDVCLVLKDYDGDPRFTEETRRNDGGPEVLYYANFVDKLDLARFYAACSAFVSPFRGEGFGMKILDAAAMGLPIVAPVYGGPADFLDPELIEAVRFREVEVAECLETRLLQWREKLAWCEVDVDDLAQAMRRVYENHAEARRRARLLRERVLADFSWQRAAEKLIAVLNEE